MTKNIKGVNYDIKDRKQEAASYKVKNKYNYNFLRKSQTYNFIAIYFF